MKAFQSLRVAIHMVCVLACAAATAAPADPPVPPGKNPGGTAIAIIGGGVDYTLDHLAQVLARDGEGEIIGYDFIDDDRRPYCTCAATATAEVVIREGQSAALIVVRADTTNVAGMGRAIGYAAETPSRITFFSEPIADQEHAALLSAAAAHFTKQIFIVPVTAGPTPVNQMTQPNLILVEAAPDQAQNDAAGTPADLVVPIDDLATQGTGESGRLDARPAALAAARVAALAVRLQAVEPKLDPLQVKERILRLAEAPPGTTSGLRYLAAPKRYFWLE